MLKIIIALNRKKNTLSFLAKRTILFIGYKMIALTILGLRNITLKNDVAICSY